MPLPLIKLWNGWWSSAIHHGTYNQKELHVESSLQGNHMPSPLWGLTIGKLQHRRSEVHSICMWEDEEWLPEGWTLYSLTVTEILYIKLIIGANNVLPDPTGSKSTLGKFQTCYGQSWTSWRIEGTLIIWSSVYCMVGISWSISKVGLLVLSTFYRIPMSRYMWHKFWNTIKDYHGFLSLYLLLYNKENFIPPFWEYFSCVFLFSSTLFIHQMPCFMCFVMESSLVLLLSFFGSKYSMMVWRTLPNLIPDDTNIMRNLCLAFFNDQVIFIFSKVIIVTRWMNFDVFRDISDFYLANILFSTSSRISEGFLWPVMGRYLNTTPHMDDLVVT